MLALAGSLTNSPPSPLPLAWPTALDQPHAVQQIGTTWSSVYSLEEREVRFCVYQDWGKVYRVRGLGG